MLLMGLTRIRVSFVVEEYMMSVELKRIWYILALGRMWYLMELRRIWCLLFRIEEVPVELWRMYM